MKTNSKTYLRILTSLLTIYGPMVGDSSFFNAPQTVSTSYVYCPGVLGSPIIMGRYCPAFRASTHEDIVWEHGGHVIGHPYSAVTFAEIVLDKPRFSYNPLKLAVNGFRSVAYPIAKTIGKRRYGLRIKERPKHTRSIANYFFDFSALNIGQYPDIALLNSTLANHRICHPNTAIVLYGDSRGAATISNFLGLNHDYTQIKAAVLEGVFDSIEHLVKHNHMPNMVKNTLYKTFKKVSHTYNDKGPFPITTASAIPHSIPLLLVTSLRDEIVPHQCTMQLYIKLKESGHPHVHLLVLSKANHMDYMYHNKNDKNRYESVVHAFYKEYGLAHNIDRACDGAHAFALTRPEPKELRTQYHLHDTCCAQINSL